MNLCTVYKSLLPGYNVSMTSNPHSHSSPGAIARERGWLRAWLPFGGVATALGFWLGAVLAPESIRGERGVWLGIPLAVYAVWAWMRGRKVLLRHERGAEGEERVAALLAQLSDRWHVFHGVPIPTGDLDHVVVGPPGLVVLETIRWTGRITLQEGRLWDGEKAYPGYEVEHLVNRSRQFAQGFGDGKVPVCTLVVVAGGRIAGGEEGPEGFSLVDESDVLDRLNALDEILLDTESLKKELETFYEHPS